VAGSLIVLHDGACAECSDIAARLSEVLRTTVLARSCRDPALRSSHPVVAALDCRAPAIGSVRADGSVRWSTGLRAAFVVLGAVRLRRLPGALALLSRVVRTRSRPRTAPGAGSTDLSA
jgi:hypothetical protein